MKKKKQNKQKTLEEKKEKTLEKNLKDPVYVNYNILLKLDEIKRINYAILEIINTLYQKILIEEEPKKSRKKKEEREGTLATKK